MPYIERTNAEALIPEQVSHEIIEEAVTRSLALSMATRLPNMVSKQTTLPVMTGSVTAGFVNGDAGIKPTSSLTWEKVNITAEELAVIVPIPEAVLSDATYDIFGEARPRITEAFAREIDLAIFHGIGKPLAWPDGLVPGAIAAGNSVAVSGNLYQDINGEEGVIAKVEEAGISVDSYIGALQLRAKLRGAVDTAGQPIFRAAYSSGAAGSMQYELNGSPIIFPRNGSLNGKEALLLAGNFSYVRYAIRQDVTYKILDQATITDGTGKVILNLAQQDCVALRAVMRLGWAMPRPVNIVSGTNYFPFAVLTPGGDGP